MVLGVLGACVVVVVVLDSGRVGDSVSEGDGADGSSARGMSIHLDVWRPSAWAFSSFSSVSVSVPRRCVSLSSAQASSRARNMAAKGRRPVR